MHEVKNVDRRFQSDRVLWPGHVPRVQRREVTDEGQLLLLFRGRVQQVADNGVKTDNIRCVSNYSINYERREGSLFNYVVGVQLYR